MPGWTDDLPTLGLDAIPAFFAAESSEKRNAAAGLDNSGRLHARQAARREFLHQLHESNAAKALPRLPAAGESFHIIMAGNFPAWNYVGTILRLADPATIAELNIVTLGFNVSIAAELLAYLDAGAIGRCSFICSVYHRANEPEMFENLATELARRGHRAMAMRSHAKILLLELTDGRCFTFESSANIRSCRNIEQAVLSHDRPLLEFHRAWMNEVLAQNEDPARA